MICDAALVHHDRRRLALRALRDHLTVIDHHPADREAGRECPSDRAAAASSRAPVGPLLCGYMSRHGRAGSWPQVVRNSWFRHVERWLAWWIREVCEWPLRFWWLGSRSLDGPVHRGSPDTEEFGEFGLGVVP